MPRCHQRTKSCAGFSLLELQVSLVVFGIALAGLGPLVIMHLRKVEKIEQRCSDQTTYYLVPATDAWARKLGAPAAIQTTDPGPPPPPPAMMVDDADAGYGESGPDDWHGHVRTAINDYLRCHDTGSGLNTASWQFTGLAPGSYEILVTWFERVDYATDAPFTVYDGATVEGTVLINQQLAPSGAVFCGRPWESLGVFSIEAATLGVELSDDANNNRVIADAVRIIPIKNVVQILALEKSLTSEDMTVHVSVNP
jgi:prepilin-type N-terminal cleavage/methylation domain-containing protein